MLPPFPARIGAEPNLPSTLSYRDAAVRSVHRWLIEGVTPTSSPRIDVAGDSPTIGRDELGFASGGIRLPQIDCH
ncbi:alpha/beta hydrolase domain-containing protein [Glutamicibacter sp. TV12E]|uniref:alpha/beta hydrolase domain-containing protein n=1 Tax=Glutamicibacter sp. TV12E TaxID=3446362 RepID=UPI00403322FF